VRSTLSFLVLPVLRPCGRARTGAGNRSSPEDASYRESPAGVCVSFHVHPQFVQA